MNTIAYRTTGLAIRTLAALSKTAIRIHGQENIPTGALIFVANHFTRIETLFLTYHTFHLTDKSPVWSLAAAELFDTSLGAFLEAVGSVSTRDPDRDKLIVKTLLTGEASWIIYPEGRMVKNKKIFERGRFLISDPEGKHPPHTGAAAFALRTEFYRRRLRHLRQHNPEEAQRLKLRFTLDTIEPVLKPKTFVVPVNVTYYPLRAHENLLNELAERFLDPVSKRVEEELMTEGAMLFSGVEIDIRFGEPIDVGAYLTHPSIDRDITTTAAFDFDDPIPSMGALRRTARRLTQDYMGAIYRMTTVNPDHLFAGLLCYGRRSRITPGDLCQRAYLAATESALTGKVHFHPRLTQESLQLIIRTEAPQLKDFLDLVETTGIVRFRNGRLFINRSKLTSGDDFHRVRIQNPIKVMANELAPLTKLRQRLQRLAWLPRWWVRRRIGRQLVEGEIVTFIRDYHRFQIEGESKPRAVGAPIFLKGRNRHLGIVLIHGYMAAPQELAPLAEHLNGCGFWVYCVRVKGHGTSPEDLSLRTHRDWIHSAQTGYAIMRHHCRKVVVGGFSNGAGLALDLAAEFEDITGVVAVCPPMKLRDPTAKLAPAVAMWNRLVGRVTADLKKEFVENRSEHPEINYTRNPIAGVKELDRLMARVEKRLPQIGIPALVIQADKDPVVDETGTRRLFELLGSEDKRYLLLHRRKHGILVGDGARQIHGAIADFVAGLGAVL